MGHLDQRSARATAAAIGAPPTAAELVRFASAPVDRRHAATEPRPAGRPGEPASASGADQPVFLVLVLFVLLGDVADVQRGERGHHRRSDRRLPRTRRRPPRVVLLGDVGDVQRGEVTTAAAAIGDATRLPARPLGESARPALARRWSS